MNTEHAVGYRAAVAGTPVLTRAGTEIGTLEHVLAAPGGQEFEGIVVATDWGLRFIDAAEVETITVRYISCRLGDSEAARLPPPAGTAVYRVSALGEIGASLDEALGRMFRRPRWMNR